VLENKPTKSKNRGTNSQPKKKKGVDEKGTGRKETALTPAEKTMRHWWSRPLMTGFSVSSGVGP